MERAKHPNDAPAPFIRARNLFASTVFVTLPQSQLRK